jgi:1,4-alpha-glucan branching enzyme
MVARGACTFVLHSHLPYCRQAGRWPHGEEWIHEAASETYLPLLSALYDLVEAGIQPKITLGLTPILTEQLADPLVVAHLVEYLHAKIAAAEREVRRQEALGRGEPLPLDLVRGPLDALEAGGQSTSNNVEQSETSTNVDLVIDATTPGVPDQEVALTHANEPFDGHKLYLARWYHTWYNATLHALQERFGGDIVGALRRLQDQGAIEIITCAATHAYLPLVSRDSTIYAQIKTAVDSYRRHFGRAPRAIWLPECAYRPAYMQGDLRKPGIEEFLEAQGITLFFAETHMIEGGTLTFKARGDAVGPYGAIPERHLVPQAEYVEPTERTTCQPYNVYQANVAVIGRNERTGAQVWSASLGYPGEALYREFHKRDSFTGLQYWRVTGPDTDLADKDVYDPGRALEKTGEHARHFAMLVADLLNDYAQRSERFGIVASNYDTELFGHWWFEGVTWLKHTLRELHGRDDIAMMTASEYVTAFPPQDALALPEGSWGQAGTHFTWINPQTEWLWPLIHSAEQEMEALVARYPDADDDATVVLNQAARELLLLQPSDWPFLITTGQAGAYATQRFNEHLSRFNLLAQHLRNDDMPSALEQAQQFYELDNPFPTIDYRDFAAREGKVEA